MSTATTPLFADRAAAGAEIARLATSLHLTHLVVAGIPRRGLEVAAAVSRALDAPLEPIGAAPLGMVDDPRLAVGGVAEDSSIVYAPDFEPTFSVMPMIEAAAESVRQAVWNEVSKFRDGYPLRDFSDKQVMLVDDFLVSPWTVLAASELARRHHATRVIIACAVGEREALDRVKALGQEVICAAAVKTLPAPSDCYAAPEPVDDARLGALLLGASP